MKQLIPLTGVLAVMIVFLCINNSCSKNSNSDNNSGGGLSTQPVAQSSFDNQSGGVYKGTLTGSSGYFEVNLQSSRPFLFYQWTSPSSGNIDTLYSTALSNWQSGQAISKALFTGADGSLFWFSVGANGSDPTIDSVYIPSHSGPVYASVSKELSTSQVKVYQGSATPASGNAAQCETAVVNIWISSGTAMGTYLAADGDHGGGDGSVSGNQLQISMGQESGALTISGNGNSISGTVSGNSCTHSLAMTRIF